MSDPVLAQLALERLCDSGMDARLTSEAGPADLYTGHQRVILWVPTEADRASGLEIVGSLERESTESTCPHCGFQLAGHSGPVTCPECGRSAHAEEQSVKCARCGETVPANFESCWNCGAPAEAGQAVIDAAEPREDASSSRSWTAAFLVSTFVFFVAGPALHATGVPGRLCAPVALAVAAILFFVLRRRWSPE